MLCRRERALLVVLACMLAYVYFRNRLDSKQEEMRLVLPAGVSADGYEVSATEALKGVSHVTSPNSMLQLRERWGKALFQPYEAEVAGFGSVKTTKTTTPPPAAKPAK